MIWRALLVLVLVMGTLFAWRAWRSLPGLAQIAAALAAAAGVLLLRSPLLAGIGLLAAVVLIAGTARTGKR